MVELQALSNFISDNRLWADSLAIISSTLLALFIAGSILKRLPAHWQSQGRRVRTRHVVTMARYPVMVSIVLIGGTQLTSRLLPLGLVESLASIFLTIAVLAWGQFVYRATQYVLKNISLQSPE